MSRPLKKVIPDILWNACVTLLVSFSLSLLWSRAFLTGKHTGAVLLFCACFSLALSLSDGFLKGWRKAALFAAAAAAAAAAAFFKTGPFFAWIQGLRALFLQWTLSQESVIWYAEEIRSFFCFVFCAAVYIQVRDDSLGTGVFVFAASAAIALVLIQYPYLPVHPFPVMEAVRILLPGCAGLVMLLSAAGGRRFGALFLAFVLAGAALLAIPSGDVRDPALADAARRLSDYARDMFYTGENRSAFSLYNTGYLPLEDRLGGAASPRDTQVMRIVAETDGPVYLKGSSCDTYTGLSWQDTLSDRGYLFSSPTSAGVKNRVFSNFQNLGIEPVSVSVTMLRDDTTTLFAPQRIVSFSPGSDRMVLYFNPAGDLYITRELAAGDKYSASYLPIDCDSPAVKELASRLQGGNDPYWNEICSSYLSVAPSVSRTVWEMAADITEGAGDRPLDLALALRDYLKQNCTYTLNGSAPGANEDFVSWFLLTERKGYCTYFASAMTVMCRMAGIPARYVTGYAATPGEDGSVVITNGMGHAWTEIYLKGFGWLTVDATASGRADLDPGPSRSSSGDRDGGGDPDGFSVSEDAPSGSVSSPSPSPAPSPSPSPDLPSPEPGGASPTPENPGPSAAPSPSGVPTVPPPPGRRGSGGRGSFPWFLIALLVLALLAAFIAVRVRLTLPSSLAARHPERAASFYYESLWRVCGAVYEPKADGETWIEYGERLSSLSGDSTFSEAANDYSALIYAKEHVPDTRLSSSLYDKLWRSCSLPKRAWLLLTRAFTR